MKSTVLPPALLAAGLLYLSSGLSAHAAGPIIVAIPAKPGAVQGTTQNSDEFIWRLFVEFTTPVTKGTASPVVFETWASDKDTFSNDPRWPNSPVAVRRFQTSALRAIANPQGGPIDVSCNPPNIPALAGFPSTGDASQCIAEEVRRNRPMFDYIVTNKLNNQAGLATAFARSFKVEMPTDAIAVKGDWIPVKTLLQWIPQISSLDRLRTLYHVGSSEGVEYGLVSLHVSSRQNTNWVWGTFEHQLTPGRCDDIGCCDTFGAVKRTVRPNTDEVNSQYGPCVKSARLRALMKAAGLSPVWDNYCLKTTQVDFVAPNGTPYVLGNAVIERIVGNGTVAASSCITCHYYASFGANGQPSGPAKSILPFNPTGRPIPAILDGSLQFDFMWGVLLAP